MYVKPCCVDLLLLFFEYFVPLRLVRARYVHPVRPSSLTNGQAPRIPRRCFGFFGCVRSELFFFKQKTAYEICVGASEPGARRSIQASAFERKRRVTSRWMSPRVTPRP